MGTRPYRLTAPIVREHPAQKPGNAVVYRGANVLPKHVWTDDERDTLKIMYRLGWPISSVATYFGVTVRAVLGQAGLLRIKHRSRCQTVEERFQRHVTRNVGSDCILWTGCRNKGGYGVFSVEGKSTLATHVVLGLVGDAKLTPGREVCHDCDNPACVNIDHLFIGTHTDNMRDARAKGRLCQTPADRKFSYIPPAECLRGHTMEGLNLYVAPSGQRACRLCRALNGTNRKLRLRAKGAAHE